MKNIIDEDKNSIVLEFGLDEAEIALFEFFKEHCTRIQEAQNTIHSAKGKIHDVTEARELKAMSVDCSAEAYEQHIVDTPIPPGLGDDMDGQPTEDDMTGIEDDLGPIDELPDTQVTIPKDNLSM